MTRENNNQLAQKFCAVMGKALDKAGFFPTKGFAVPLPDTDVVFIRLGRQS